MTKGLFIEPPMTEAEAAARVTPGERAAAQEFLRERRRREFLTWRAVVRRELGDDVSIAYDEAGAPGAYRGFALSGPGGGLHIGCAVRRRYRAGVAGFQPRRAALHVACRAGAF